MRKLNLKPYMITQTYIDKQGTLQTRQTPYDITRSIEEIVLASGNITEPLTNRQLLEYAKITDKIKNKTNHEKDGTILLEESEYAIIAKRFDQFKGGYGKNDVELCKRIQEAKTVNVEEKKK